MMLRPCISLYIINFPESRRSSRRPLNDAQTLYFTLFYNILLTFPDLGGAPETTRCCSDRVFYNILSTFPGLRGAPGDRSMLLRPCILQYIINFPGSQRSSGDHWMLLRPCILQYIINSPGSRRSSGTARCDSDRAFYNL